MVKKHTRPLIIYILRAEYILLLTLMEPNSDPRAGWPSDLINNRMMDGMGGHTGNMHAPDELNALSGVGFL